MEYPAISPAGFLSDSCMLFQDNNAELLAPVLAGQFSGACASDHAAADYADIIRLHGDEPSTCDYETICRGAAGDAPPGALCPILWHIGTGTFSLCFAAVAAKPSF